MRRRIGVSMTMTMIVIAVMVIAGGAVVSMQGGDVLSLIGQDTGESELSSAVSHACSDLGGTIDEEYCSWHVQTDPLRCGAVQQLSSQNYGKTATQAGCDWLSQAQSDDAPNSIDDLLTEGRPIVTVRGNEYDCVAGNFMTPICPAGEVGDGSIGSAEVTNIGDGGGEGGGEGGEGGGSTELELVSHNVPDSVADVDIHTFLATIEPAADAVRIVVGGDAYQLYDDGNHNDGGSEDNQYGNTIDVGDLSGTEEVRIVAEKGGSTDTLLSTFVTFEETPPAPDVTARFGDGGGELQVDVTYDYGTVPTMALDLAIEESVQTSRTINCPSASDCSTTINLDNLDHELETGDRALVEVQMNVNGQESERAQDAATYATEPMLTEALYESPSGNRVLGDTGWTADIGVAKGGFMQDDIADIYMHTRDGRIGEVTATAELGDVVLFGGSGGDILAPWSAEIPDDEVVTDEPIQLTVELTDGTTLTADLVTLERVTDNEAPELAFFEPVGYTDDGAKRVSIRVKDNYSQQVSCTATIVETGTEVADCSLELAEPFDDGKLEGGTAFAFMPPGDLATGTMRFELTDAAGNTQEVTREVVLNPEEMLEPVETHGDPSTKINMIVHGHDMTPDETAQTVQRNLDVMFGQNIDHELGDGTYDWGNLASYRSYFNWYVVQEEDLCEQVDGSDGDALDCPDGISELKSLREAPPINDNRAGVLIMVSADETEDGQWIRSYATYDYSIISEQGDDADPFTHELGHLIWSFNDEYGDNPATRRPMRDSYFFPDSMNSGGFNVYQYPNIWNERENCVSNVSAYYSSLSEGNCYQQVSGNDDAPSDGYIIQKNEHEGYSLMKSSSNYRFYPNHDARVENLMENNPVYTPG